MPRQRRSHQRGGRSAPAHEVVCRDTDDLPPLGGERRVFLEVAAPLAIVREVVVPLDLDDDPALRVHSVADPDETPALCADLDVELGLGKARSGEREAHVGLKRRHAALTNEGERVE